MSASQAADTVWTTWVRGLSQHTKDAISKHDEQRLRALVEDEYRTCVTSGEVAVARDPDLAAQIRERLGTIIPQAENT